MNQKYTYLHTNTDGLTGYFACEPEPSMSIDAALVCLATRPFDTFLRSYLIRKLVALDDAAFADMWEQVFGEDTGFTRLWLRVFGETPSAHLPIQACLAESAIVRGNTAVEGLTKQQFVELSAASSLPDLAWYKCANSAAVRAWNTFIRPNIIEHRALPFYDPNENDAKDDADDDEDDADTPKLPTPYTLASLKNLLAHIKATPPLLADIHGRMLQEDRQNNHKQWERPPAEETAALALSRLTDAGIVAGEEARHEATLSPVGLLRPWRVSMQVQQGRHAYEVLGQGTTYGRGLSVGAARASCLMEMVERASAYASVTTHDGQSIVTQRAVDTPLIRTSYSKLLQEGRAAFNPNALPLEVPYADQIIHWIEGFDFHGGEVLVPFQAVCLFVNLDEPDLCMMPSSTGLATGASLDDAIVAGCMEIFERDAEAALPWNRSQCFTIKPNESVNEPVNEPGLTTLLAAYAAQDIHVFFRDMTGAIGIPAYQACVRHADGRMAHGAAAHLSGKKALISALTETPFPFRLTEHTGKNAPKSAPALSGLPVRNVEDLPDWTLANPTRHVALLATLMQSEAILQKGEAQDTQAVYVPLTRKDLGFPVVRVLIPHKILSADVDNWAKPHPHFMAQYCCAE